MKKILEVIHGSNLYGLNTPKSDLDIYGIYLENKDEIIEDYFYSKQKGREVDLSEVYKLPNGKNSPDSVDKKFLSFKKYVGLALNCNPNINEVLFAPNDKILFNSDIGQQLIDIRGDFLSKKAYYTFGAYAKSQSKRARVQADSFNRIEQLQNYLEEKIENKKDYMFVYEKDSWFTGLLEIKQHHYKIKGTQYQILKNITVKNFIKEIEKVIGQKTNRKDLIKQSGYDRKFQSHTLRLLYECEDILLNKTINFPIKGKDEVMAIKIGDVSLPEAEILIKEKWNDVENAFLASKLPEVPNQEKIFKFVKEVYNNEYFK